MRDPDLRQLLIQRHTLALAVSSELEALHAELLAQLVELIDASTVWKELKSAHDTRSKRYPVDKLPGYWWEADFPKADWKEYTAGVGVHVADVDGALGVGVYLQMNQKPTGLSGTEFRSAVANGSEATLLLPEGDSSEWIPRGIVRSTIASDPFETLVARASAKAEAYLRYTGLLTRRLIEERS